MKISIIIALEKNPELCLDLLGSIQKQTVANYEVLFTCSKENGEVIAKMTPYLSNQILLVTGEGKDIASLRNLGFKHARGEYILFLEDAYQVDPNFVEQLMETEKDNPGVDIIRYQQKLVNAENQVTRRVFDIAFSKLPGTKALRTLKNGEYLEPIYLYAFRTQYLKEKELQFQEGKGEYDFGFVPLALFLANSVVSISYPGVYYKEKEKSLTTHQVYDTLFQYDVMKKRVIEEEHIDITSKKIFFDYISYQLILKGTKLPIDQIPAYAEEVKKKDVVRDLRATSISNMLIKAKIERDMSSFIKKEKSKMK